MRAQGKYINQDNQEIDFEINDVQDLDSVIEWVESQSDWNGGQMSFDLIN